MTVRQNQELTDFVVSEIADIISNDPVCKHQKFDNSGVIIYPLASNLNYNLLYDFTNDRLIVAKYLEISKPEIFVNDICACCWGQGWYGETLNYKNLYATTKDMIKFYIEKAL